MTTLPHYARLREGHLVARTDPQDTRKAKYIDGLVYAFLGGAGAFAGIAAALTLHSIGG
ncbi:hypothetical protein [Roseovarius sp.]|uniref:hypothetical protein n=1 Tax=Roseovarius sp. TaxID=1486281 RepID=UPI003BAACAB8